ncbi:MAG: hypothetical protein QNK34_13475, partial [Woeseiaceae bacterium]|nr:hypothetical protein [Woeseiaceae bacterium]
VSRPRAGDDNESNRQLKDVCFANYGHNEFPRMPVYATIPASLYTRYALRHGNGSRELDLE